jgi:hypothetical protein
MGGHEVLNFNNHVYLSIAHCLLLNKRCACTHNTIHCILMQLIYIFFHKGFSYKLCCEMHGNLIGDFIGS